MPIKLRRLIDCTYLHSVVRCLRGRAVHPDDLGNFLRVVGEVLVADRLMFTADVLGPVYRPAMEAASELQEAIGDATLLRHFDISSLDHAKACEKAAIDLASDLRSCDLFVSGGGVVSPDFENAVEDPDVSFFDDLRTAVREPGLRLPKPTLEPSTVSRYVLTRPVVLDAMRDTKLLDNFTGTEDYLRLTASVRSIVYRHMGGRLNAVYLPATSRAKLLLSNQTLVDTIGAIPAEVERGAPLFSLASAVDAVVRLSSGDPREILRRAWQWRNTLAPLKEDLVQRVQGDALGSSFKKASQLRSMTKEFEGIVAGDPGPRLMDALDFQLVFFGIPVVKVQGGKLQDYLTRNRAMRRLGSFADLIRDARDLQAISAYKILLHRAGFRDDQPGKIDAASDVRTPRLR